MRLDDVNTEVRNSYVKEFDEYIDDLRDLMAISQILVAESESLYNEGLLNEDLVIYVKFRTQSVIDLNNILTQQEGKTTDEVSREILAIGDKESGVDFNVALDKWHSDVLDPIKDEMNKIGEEEYKKAKLVSDHYSSNKLGEDFISLLISKVSDKWPKNY